MIVEMDRRTFVMSLASAPAATAASRPPNVVLITADDLGYGDLGCYGSPLKTPNLNRMAGEGTQFTTFYSASPVCSPSRAALLTGRYPVRVGVPAVLFPNSTTGLNPGEVTIAQMLKRANYRTSCVGKWHLGHLPQFLPNKRGFDSYFGIPYSNDMNPRPLLEQNGEKTAVVEEEARLDNLTSRYTERACGFIESAKDAPFFLYMPHTFPHIPLSASPNFKGKSDFGLYGDVVAELDWSVGEVLKAIQRAGQDRNTLVLFTSDNGPWFQGSPGKLRGRKGSTLEGGVRVPFLARMPGRTGKGRVVNGVASAMDILPTVAALTGVALPNSVLDGINILEMVEGRRQSIDREVLLFFDGRELQCARWKQWKLHLARFNSFAYSPPPAVGRMNLLLDPPELYNVADDVDESFDVAAKHPAVVKEIRDRVLRLIGGFPADVRERWNALARKKTRPAEPGRLPVPLAN